MNVRDQITLVEKTLNAKTTQADSTAHANQDLNQWPTNPWFVKASSLIYLWSLWPCSIFQTLNLRNCLVKYLQFSALSLACSFFPFFFSYSKYPVICNMDRVHFTYTYMSLYLFIYFFHSFFSFSDIDECEDTSLHTCSGQSLKCVNHPGGYSCTCAPGYKPVVSGKSEGQDIQCEEIAPSTPALCKHYFKIYFFG